MSFHEARDVGWHRVGIGTNKQMHMVRLNRQPNHLPMAFFRNLMENRRQPVMNGAMQDFASPLGTPDDVVDHQVDAVMLVLILHVDAIARSNIACKARGPFIPRLKDGGFLAYFCKEKATATIPPTKNV